MIRFSICGAASYACGELLRLMVNHPETQVAHLADSFAAGRKIQDEHPALAGFYDQEILPLNDETVDMIVKDSDVVFTAVDAGTVCGIAEKVLAGGRGHRVRHCREGAGGRQEVHRLRRRHPVP